MSDVAVITFVLFTFGAVVAAVFGIGRYMHVQMQIQRRLPAYGVGGDSPSAHSTARLYAFIAKHFDRAGGQRDALAQILVCAPVEFYEFQRSSPQCRYGVQDFDGFRSNFFSYAVAGYDRDSRRRTT